MRVDKFLKISRILKRRTISKELALHQRIKINDRLVKPSHEVKIGDILEVQYPRCSNSFYSRKSEKGNSHGNV